MPLHMSTDIKENLKNTSAIRSFLYGLINSPKSMKSVFIKNHNLIPDTLFQKTEHQSENRTRNMAKMQTQLIQGFMMENLTP